MAKAGTFVWANIPFAEGDGRSKIRPVLVLARTRLPNGDVAYLGAGKYSSTDKVRGSIEVMLTQAEALEVGMDKAGVLRFSRGDLVAFLAVTSKVNRAITPGCRPQNKRPFAVQLKLCGLTSNQNANPHRLAFFLSGILFFGGWFQPKAFDFVATALQ